MKGDENDYLHDQKRRFIVHKKNDRKKTYLALCILWILFLSVSVIAFFTFYYSNENRIIKSIQVTGYKHTTPTEIILAINPLLNTHYLGSIPVNNYMFFPRDIAKKNLMTQFPGLSNVTFSFNKNTLGIFVDEKSISSLVCNTQAKDTDNEQCYFLDHLARPYGMAPRMSTGLYKKFYIDQVEFLDKTRTKESVFTMQEFSDLSNILNELENKESISIDAITFDVEKLSMRMHVYRMRDWYPIDLMIRFSFDTISVMNAPVTLLGIHSLFEKIIMSDGDITHMYDIEYIDCRFIEKVLYKRKTGNEEQVSV